MGLRELIADCFSADENVYAANTWNVNDHEGTVMELYDSKANAESHDGVTGFIARYTLTVNNSGGKPQSQLMVLED